MGNRYSCRYNQGDDDCLKCEIHGYIRRGGCSFCPDYEEPPREIPEEIAQRYREERGDGTEVN